MDSWFGFTERYRAYVNNYVLGQDLVDAYVKRENATGDEEGDGWHSPSCCHTHNAAVIR